MDEQVNTELVRVDRWSKILALCFAMALFALASVLTPHVQFNASAAAVGGIGIRLYIPYHAGVSGYGLDSVPSQARPETGNYNHGAVGGGLVAGSLAAIAGMVLTSRYGVALAAGLGVAVVTYLGLRALLPLGAE
jgi:hypothetical protein